MAAKDLSHKSQEQVKMLANEQMLNSDGFILITTTNGSIGHVYNLRDISTVEGYGVLSYGERICRIRADDRAFRNTSVETSEDDLS